MADVGFSSSASAGMIASEATRPIAMRSIAVLPEMPSPEHPTAKRPMWFALARIVEKAGRRPRAGASPAKQGVAPGTAPNLPPEGRSKSAKPISGGGLLVPLRAPPSEAEALGLDHAFELGDLGDD